MDFAIVILPCSLLTLTFWISIAQFTMSFTTFWYKDTEA